MSAEVEEIEAALKAGATILMQYDGAEFTVTVTGMRESSTAPGAELREALEWALDGWWMEVEPMECRAQEAPPRVVPEGSNVVQFRGRKG